MFILVFAETEPIGLALERMVRLLAPEALVLEHFPLPPTCSEAERVSWFASLADRIERLSEGTPLRRCVAVAATSDATSMQPVPGLAGSSEPSGDWNPLLAHCTGNLLVWLTLAFPEVHWVVSPRTEPESFPQRLREILFLASAEAAAIFDPLGCRAEARKHLKREGVTNHDGDCVVLEDEASHAWLNAYAGYRFGHFRTWTVTRWRLAEHLLKESDGHSLDLRLVVEDVYLGFPDKPSGVSLRVIEDRDRAHFTLLHQLPPGKPYRLVLTGGCGGPNCHNALAREERGNRAYIEFDKKGTWLEKPVAGLFSLQKRVAAFQPLLTTFHSGEGSDPTIYIRPKRSAALHSAQKDRPADDLPKAGAYGIGNSGRRLRAGERTRVSVEPAPEWFVSGWRGTQIERTTEHNNWVVMPPVHHVVGVNYSKSSQAAHSGHAAPGRLTMLSERLVNRSEKLLENASSVPDAIHAAVLSLDAKELLSGRTPTLALEALAQQHRAEAAAEAMFFGVSTKIRVWERQGEYLAEVRRIFPGGGTVRLWERRGRDKLHWAARGLLDRARQFTERLIPGVVSARRRRDAAALVGEGVARQFGRFGQFDEERESAADPSDQRFKLWYLRFLMRSPRGFNLLVGLCVGWLFFAATWYAFLSPLSMGTPYPVFEEPPYAAAIAPVLASPSSEGSDMPAGTHGELGRLRRPTQDAVTSEPELIPNAAIDKGTLVPKVSLQGRSAGSLERKDGSTTETPAEIPPKEEKRMARGSPAKTTSPRLTTSHLSSQRPSRIEFLEAPIENVSFTGCLVYSIGWSLSGESPEPINKGVLSSDGKYWWGASAWLVWRFLLLLEGAWSFFHLGVAISLIVSSLTRR